MDILIFLGALSVLVLVHELGHFLMARWNGVRVEEFGLGLPPKIWGKRIGETEYTLNALPIGGFVRMYGEEATFAENQSESQKLKVKSEEARSFAEKKPWQKFLIVVGGVMMNLVMAILIFTVVYSILGVPEERNEVKVIGVAKGSPAEEVGLKEGMVIKEVAGEKISKPNELIEKVAKFKGKEVELTVGVHGNAPVQKGVGGNTPVQGEAKNDESLQKIRILVRENPPAGEGSMGVAISNVEMVKPHWWELHKGVMAGFKEALFWGKVIAGGVGSMIKSLVGGQVPKDISGPIGMYQATSQIKQTQGLWALLHFFGVVSVNLAVVNILPFPALDGGRIIFVLYEMLTRKKANPRLEATINNVGMLVLLTLIVLITVGDVVRIMRN
jgi:regulator of sigma E protease